LDDAAAAAATAGYHASYEKAYSSVPGYKAKTDTLGGKWMGLQQAGDVTARVETGLAEADIKRIAAASIVLPEG
jgi:hypothetical protein